MTPYRAEPTWQAWTYGLDTAQNSFAAAYQCICVQQHFLKNIHPLKHLPLEATLHHKQASIAPFQKGLLMHQNYAQIDDTLNYQ
jgi:hypothetical protein